MKVHEIQDAARTQVSFRISEPHLIPEEVTKNLNLRPDHVHRQGDFPKANPKYSVYKHGMWLLKSKLSEEQPLETHLDSLLSILEPNRPYIQLLSQSASVDFYCILYAQGGFQLSSRILKRISALEAVLGVVVYNDDVISDAESQLMV